MSAATVEAWLKRTTERPKSPMAKTQGWARMISESDETICVLLPSKKQLPSHPSPTMEIDRDDARDRDRCLDRVAGAGSRRRAS
jgi:hypothetical protein